jgi:predicted RNA-binding Zn-ribbon protein involved in translation (DUF1610 family)
MPIIPCPHCKRTLNVRENYAGPVKCPACKNQFVVEPQKPILLDIEDVMLVPPPPPALPGADRPPLIEEPPLSPTSSPWLENPGNPREAFVSKACPTCGEQILAAALKCRYCGSVLADATRGPPSPRLPQKGFDLEKILKRFGIYQWCGIAGSLLCFLAGCQMLSIQSAASQYGQGSVFDSAFHGIGLYFIGKAFVVGPLLFSMERRSDPRPSNELPADVGGDEDNRRR